MTHIVDVMIFMIQSKYRI